MKQLFNLFLLVALMVGFIQSAEAQVKGTRNSGITLRVTIDGVVTDYGEFECGYGTAAWGDSLKNDICAPAQWAKDLVGGDSLVCDSIMAGSLTGKVALVRRGACAAPNTAAGNFSAKALNAYKAGAVAVLIANNSATAGQNDCYVQNIAAGTAAVAAAVKVPVLFICRAVANQIDAAIKAGKAVEICLYRPEVLVKSSFYPVSSGQTPASQIAKDSFGFSMTVTNSRGVNLNNVQLKASVQTTAGVELFSSVLNIPVLTGDVKDSLFVFPDLYAPELAVGNYRIVYSSQADPVNGNQFKQFRRYSFNVTDRLWSKDVSGPQVGYRPGTIPEDGWSVANVYQLTAGSQDQYVIKTVEFAHATNAADLAITAVVADAYILESNDDLLEDYSNFDDADLFSSSLTFKGTGNYTAPTNATNYALQQVQVENIDDPTIPGVKVQPGKRYFIVMNYNGPNRFVFHAFNEDFQIPGIGTATYSTQWFLGGFSGDPTAVLRAYLDLLVTTDEKQLPETAMQVQPNPIRETLNLKLAFDKATDATITIAEISGRVIRVEDRNITSETVSYQLPELAAGTYLVRVATKEGTLTKKFVVAK